MRPIIATVLSALMALPALPQQAANQTLNTKGGPTKISVTTQLVIVDGVR